MVYVFEDSKNSLLSKLFEQAYPSEVASTFHYTRGNRKIKTYITNNLDKKEQIIVLLDVMPGNKDLRDCYYEIAELLPDYKNLRIFPIMCKEYYLLQALSGSSRVINQNWVDTCLDFGFPQDTKPPILVTAEEKEYCTTAERFSKIVARKALSQCVRVGVIQAGETTVRHYYSEDCICGEEMVGCGCVPDSLRNKACKYVRRFRVFPAGSFIPDVIDIPWGRTVDTHKKLVDIYNAITERMRSSGKTWKDSFERLEYVHM